MELKTLFRLINVIYVQRCIKLIEKYPDHATFKHIKCVTMATDLLSIDSPLYMRVFGYIVQYHRKHLCKEFVCISYYTDIWKTNNMMRSIQNLPATKSVIWIVAMETAFNYQIFQISHCKIWQIRVGMSYVLVVFDLRLTKFLANNNNNNHVPI